MPRVKNRLYVNLPVLCSSSRWHLNSLATEELKWNMWGLRKSFRWYKKKILRMQRRQFNLSILKNCQVAFCCIPNTQLKKLAKKMSILAASGNLLKGQSIEIFYLRFFHKWTPPKPITRYLKTFWMWLRIPGDIRDFWLTLHYWL